MRTLPTIKRPQANENYGNHKCSGTDAVLEPTPRNAALPESKSERANTTKFLVRVTSYRKFLLDEDNLCEKYYVDCVRNSGIIPGDSPAEAKIEVSQEKVVSTSAERVKIEVFEL